MEQKQEKQQNMQHCPTKFANYLQVFLTLKKNQNETQKPRNV